MASYERKTVDILISDELRDVLTQIEGDSVVASLLLKKRHRKEELVDSPVNYISISSEDKGKISYLSQDRIADLDPDTLWTSSRRYQAKPGGFLSKLFKNVSPKDVEKFSNLFRAQSVKIDFTFRVVNGEEIANYYHYSSYSSESRGSLGASCMKHDSCQRLLGIYTDNSQVTLLAMLNTEGELIGRSLLWDFDGNKIMDRVYSKNDEELLFHFKKWATENGYLYKSEQNWYNTLFFENLNTKRTEIKFEIKFDEIPKRLPYMDTFKFVDFETKTIANYIMNDNVYTMVSSDGGYHDADYLRFDSIDRVFRYRNESVYLPYLNIYTTRSNTEYSSINDQYILREHLMYDEVVRDYVFIGEYEDKNNPTLAKLRAQAAARTPIVTLDWRSIDLETSGEAMMQGFGSIIRETVIPVDETELPF